MADTSPLDRIAAARAAVERQLRVAHWMGEMTITMARRRLEQELQSLRTSPAASPEPEADTVLGDTPPFDDYPTLTAAQVVPMLADLPHGELQLVREYEVAHRNRRTIVAKIDQLLVR